MSAPTPKPHPRHRALAVVNKLIEQAEQAQAQQRAETERIIAEGRELRHPTKVRDFAAERLAMLYRSREAILSGEAGYRSEGS